MRIGFISLMDGLPWGGSETLWFETAKYALSCKDEVIISVFDWGKLPKQLEEIKKSGAKVHLRKRYNPNERILKKIKTVVATRILKFSFSYEHLLAFKPDAVVISQGNNFDLAVHHQNLYKLLNENHIPFFLLCHSHNQYGDIPEMNVFPRAVEIFRNAKKVFFVSSRMQELTERKLCLRLHNALRTWNPLNLSHHNYLAYPDDSTVMFAVVGALGGGKGHDTLFEVLGDEKWKTRNWQLNIYGEGYGERYLRELAKFYGISENVVFNGYVNSANDVWIDNHILLIPSSGEGLPISLVEAMVCGRAAVVTDVGGNTELISDQINGFVAEAPSVSSFSKAMEYAWMHKNIWRELGETARKIAMEVVDFEPQVKLYKAIINSD